MKELNEEQLEQLLKSVAKKSQPSPKFKQQLSQKLEDKFKDLNGKPSFFELFPSLFLRFKFQLSSALTVLLITSTTIYAYNSPSVVNGDLLYPIKVSIEKVEETFAKTPEAKADFYGRMAERRLAELERIKASDQREDEQTVLQVIRMIDLSESNLINFPAREIESEPTMQSKDPSTDSFTIKEVIPPANQLMKVDIYLPTEITEKFARLRAAKDKLVEEHLQEDETIRRIQEESSKVFKDQEEFNQTLERLKIHSELLEVSPRPPSSSKREKNERKPEIKSKIRVNKLIKKAPLTVEIITPKVEVTLPPVEVKIETEKDDDNEDDDDKDKEKEENSEKEDQTENESSKVEVNSEIKTEANRLIERVPLRKIENLRILP